MIRSETMKVKGKKLISLFLVLSLLAVSCTTLKHPGKAEIAPSQKRGVDLVIQNKDGLVVGGELIAVKESTLILMVSKSGMDVSVDIKDIRIIKIIKKSKALITATGGLFFGMFFGLLATRDCGESMFSGVCMAAGIGGLAVFGTLIGAIIGGHTGTDETIEIEKLIEKYQGEAVIVKGERRSRAKAELDKILEKLRSKARVENYQ